MSAPLRREGDDVVLMVHAQPGAKQSAFAGVHGDALKIRLAAPALEGRANRELCRFLAGEFAVTVSAVTVLSGEGARRKRVHVEGPVQWPEALAAWRD